MSRLVTLGSPHYSLELYPFGRIAERREGEPNELSEEEKGSSIRLCNKYYPGKYSWTALAAVNFSWVCRL